MKKITALLMAAIIAASFLPGEVSGAERETPVRVGWFAYKGSQEIIGGNPCGYNYDYLMEIADYTGWKYEFVEASLQECLDMLTKGELDILGCLFRNQQRLDTYDFASLEFGHTYTTLFTAQQSEIAAYDFNAFKGVTVGVINNSVNEGYLKDYAALNGFTYTAVPFDSSQSVVNAVVEERVNCGLLGAYVSDEKTRVLAEFAPLPYYFATTKGNTSILTGLNYALSQIRLDSPYLELELYQKYFSATESIRLTGAELKAVQASHSNPVVIGIVDNSAPISYWDEKENKYKGISMEMLEAISIKTGLCFEYVPMDISLREKAKIPPDTTPKLVAAVTDDRSLSGERGWSLSESIFSDTFAVVTKRGTNISEDQSGKIIAVVEGAEAVGLYARKYFPECSFTEYESLEDSLDAVTKGEADAAVYLRICANYQFQKPRFDSLEILPAYEEDIDLCVAGFSDEAKLYLGIIDKGMRMMTETEIRGIAINYTVMNPYQMSIADMVYRYKTSFIVILIMFLALIAALVWVIRTRKKSAAKIEEALVLAEKASAAKGSFMSRMSHEIRTPLNAVIGYNTIARGELTEAKTDEERRRAEMKVMDCLTKSDIASKHLLTIINDVLDMSAIESGKIVLQRERFDFRGLISSLTAIFYSQAKSKGVDFDVSFEGGMDEWIVGDQTRVNQVLTNILSNAVKFTLEGGRVSLVIHPQVREEAIDVRFEITDTGIGMSEEFIERIWMPFEQADPSISRRFGGTGLGLSITKTLVDLMKGSVSVESKLGQGSVFIIELSFGRTLQPINHSPYDFSAINALVVDDDEATCDYMRFLLNRSEVRCASVTSGHDAVDAVYAAIKEKDPYTLCFVDWRMPKMDGIETIRRIRNIAGEKLPIIVITAYDFTEVADKAAEVGVNTFISKPLFQSSVFNLLANISGGRPEGIKNAAKIDFGGARVLLAEDNAMNMEIARGILESAKLTVDCAWNGEEALKIFEEAEQGKYKAILMDVQMPVMDGYAATKAIRASDKPEAATIPIIAMTADAFAENVAQSLSSGMNAHISKPIDLTDLFDTLGRYIK